MRRVAHAGLVLEALEQTIHYRWLAIAAAWFMIRTAGSQHVGIRYTVRLAEPGIEPSVGSIGDSYDNA